MTGFDWDPRKEAINIEKHGVSFSIAVRVFGDPKRKVILDLKHIAREQRFFCIGSIDGRILTVRFVYRGEVIRIFGAGYWRMGREIYEKKAEET